MLKFRKAKPMEVCIGCMPCVPCIGLLSAGPSNKQHKKLAIDQHIWPLAHNIKPHQVPVRDLRRIQVYYQRHHTAWHQELAGVARIPPRSVIIDPAAQALTLMPGVVLARRVLRFLLVVVAVHLVGSLHTDSGTIKA